MRIAIDFDNTIVAYDELFAAVARERGLIGPGPWTTKTEIRDRVRSRRGGESMWQALQADVYGVLIARAPIFPGVTAFVASARRRGARIAIVSHKTAFAAARPDGPDLRAAARSWLDSSGLIGDASIAACDVHFESSRRGKLERIAAWRADIVIDDLIEVLIDPLVPTNTRRWHFAPGRVAPSVAGVESFHDWHELRVALESFAPC